MLSGESGNCKVGDYMTHPAFISMNTTGLWVGKFETGYKGSTNQANAQKNVVEPGSVQIKPNVYSWRSIQVANAFYTSYDYKRELDSHMMKNTEWGAVAYLSHSKYGRTSNIRINNNSNFVTGYAAVKEPTCGYINVSEECNKYGTDSSVTQPWNTSVGYLASTTGNITGIYDMNGGAWEYVSGAMLDEQGVPVSGRSNKRNSGFNGPFTDMERDDDNSPNTSLTTGLDYLDNPKYYDFYKYSTNDMMFLHRILGDATGELGPFYVKFYPKSSEHVNSWYEGPSRFVDKTNGFNGRGGGMNRGISSGIFAFGYGSGESSDLSFRIVLTNGGENQ
jgi:hypothetical protein